MQKKKIFNERRSIGSQPRFGHSFHADTITFAKGKAFHLLGTRYMNIDGQATKYESH